MGVPFEPGHATKIYVAQGGNTEVTASGGTSLIEPGGDLTNNGHENKGSGVSTAAAGTTTADAGVLPAGTAPVYPTTAADGTKGVRVNAADKVTGRTIMIGNGVAAAVLKIYAPSGGAINGAAADAAYSTKSGGGAVLYCLDATGNTWLAWG